MALGRHRRVDRIGLQLRQPGSSHAGGHRSHGRTRGRLNPLSGLPNTTAEDITFVVDRVSTVVAALRKKSGLPASA